MKKAIVIAGALLLGSSAVMADQKLAVEQDNFMRALGKGVYVTMLKMSKGELVTALEKESNTRTSGSGGSGCHAATHELF